MPDLAVFGIVADAYGKVCKEVDVIISSRQTAKTLSSKLEEVQKKLQDAGRQGVVDVMYEADDALDKWEAMESELDIQEAAYEDASAACDKVYYVFSSLCSCVEHVRGRREIVLKMMTLSPKLDKILEGKGTNYSDSSREYIEFRPGETVSHHDPSKIYGRHDDKERLVEMLQSEGEVKGVRVISIFGLAGIGKTEVARLVFNDPRVQGFFDFKRWVSVPYPFDATKTAKAILQRAEPISRDWLQMLQELLKNFPSDKKILLVLDNIRIDESDQWRTLKDLLAAAPRCVILVTTTSKTTANMMSSNQIKELTFIDCGRIFNEIGEKEENLTKFRLRIEKKCSGWPLAAIAIVELLKQRSTEPEWEDVLRSSLWKYEKEINYLHRNLQFRYNELSPILKLCFVSCVLCRKGSRLHCDKLTRMWMAQGYISTRATWEDIRLKGLGYFQQLSMRSFFQEMEKKKDDKGNLSCKMHDIMHDFAHHLSTSQYYFIQDGGTDQLNVASDSIGKIRNFCAKSVSQQLLLDFLKDLQSVRVLCLSDCNLKELPPEVGKLIHLKYLDVSGNQIKELPETVSNLHNLQTLDLERCRSLRKLPNEMWKLKKLRHLLISDTDDLVQFPQGLEKLKGLWTLHRFRATSDTVGYLRDLNELKGDLKIEFQSLNDPDEAEKANLRTKTQIKRLELLFFADVPMEVINAIVTNAMVTPPELQVCSTSSSDGCKKYVYLKRDA